MNFSEIKKYKWVYQSLLFALFIFFGATSSEAQNTVKEQVSIHVKNQSVKKVFDEISRQTGIKFLYGKSVVDKNLKVSLSHDNENLNTVLTDITRQVKLHFNRENNTVAVTLTPMQRQQASSTPRTITGTITDDSGEPIIGANIMIKGTNNGTITDINGNYSLEVTGNDILHITYIGYLAQEVLVSNNTKLDISLTEDTQTLEEVVVVGYGIQKKNNLSGAVSKASSEIIESKPSANLISSLQGEIPGLLIQRNSGQPGNESFNLNVRGASSTNGGNTPLVLIDGIPGDLNLVNPQDVSQISVLKDAAASIYGARAAGGVVLITTKKGSKGTPTVSYSGNFALTKTTGLMEKPNAYEMAIMDNEANIHNGAAPIYTNELLQRIKNNDPNPIDHPTLAGYKLFFTSTDWLGELIENGIQHKHNISISGGGEKSNYYLSAGYSKQFGTIRYADDNNEKYNLRMNYGYQLSDWLTLNTKLALENQKRTDIGAMGAWVIGEAMYDMPNFPIYNADGNYFTQGGWANAIAWAKDGATATYKTREMNANVELVANLLKGLTLNGQIGLRYQHNNDEDIAKAIPLYNWDNNIAYYTLAGNPKQSNVSRKSGETIYQNYTGYLSYNNDFNNHNLNAMVGLSYETEKSDWFSAWRDNFLTDNLWNLNLGGTDNMSNSAGAEHWAIASVFSRISYNYKHKYIIETNLRYDGSSRFAKNNRWRIFPGISASWRISQESFMKNNKIFNELKIRGSFGQTGNQEGIRLYDYIQLLELAGSTYPFGDGSQTQSIKMGSLAGVGRTWEILNNSNIGIDMEFLNNRLGVSFDYFWKVNDNMLIPITYPSMLGATAPDSNSGKLRTRGFELTLKWADKVNKDFSYSVMFQLSDAVNKLIDYGGADTYNLGLNAVREGYPLNSYFAYVYDGVIRNQAELDEYKKLEGVPSDIGIGDAKFKDLNKDGKISTYGNGDDGDAVFAGSNAPRYTFGLNLNAKWKNFDIGAFFQGVGKRTMFRVGEFAMPWSDWWRCPPRFYYGKTWNEDRQDAYYPRLTYGDIRHWNYQASTLQKINAAYVRLKNLQIGYTLPKKFLQKLKLERTRVYVSGQDLFEIHNVEGGWDPESASDGYNYPFQRYYSVGIDITF